jgi:hypothetical protein
MLEIVTILLIQAGAGVPATADDWMSDARRASALTAAARYAHRCDAKNTIPRSWGTVLIRAPHARLRAAAIKAREKYMELTPAEIAALWTPTVEIVAMPDRPETVTSRVVNVEHVVVMTPSGPVQPVSTVAIPQSAANAFGASVSWKGLVATFPLDVLRDGNTLHLIVDGPVTVHDEDGLFKEGSEQRAKDDPVLFSAKMIDRLKELGPPPCAPPPRQD